MPSITKRTGFIIMPFGHKPDPTNPGQKIDFDKVRTEVIDKAVAGLDIAFWRADDRNEPGPITDRMLKDIHRADVVVADLTIPNANVFYELGVRHALRSGTTVLIARAGSERYFDIKDLNRIEYDLARPRILDKARASIATHIREGLKGVVDSPVKLSLNIPLPEFDERLEPGTLVPYAVSGCKYRRVGLITGDILDVKWADAWVNSENTNMQMSRFYDRSVSAVIRHHGRNNGDGEDRDYINVNLRKQMGGRYSVDPGSVLVTEAGGLAASHGVKRIFHVAAVQGSVGKGYQPVNDLEGCVANVLTEASKHANVLSVVSPLLGTGTGGADLVETAGRLLSSATTWFRTHSKSSALRGLYFIVRSDRQYEACRNALEQLVEKKRIKPLATKHV